MTVAVAVVVAVTKLPRLIKLMEVTAMGEGVRLWAARVDVSLPVRSCKLIRGRRYHAPNVFAVHEGAV